MIRTHDILFAVFAATGLALAIRSGSSLGIVLGFIAVGLMAYPILFGAYCELRVRQLRSRIIRECAIKLGRDLTPYEVGIVDARLAEIAASSPREVVA